MKKNVPNFDDVDDWETGGSVSGDLWGNQPQQVKKPQDTWNSGDDWDDEAPAPVHGRKKASPGKPAAARPAPSVPSGGGWDDPAPGPGPGRAGKGKGLVIALITVLVLAVIAGVLLVTGVFDGNTPAGATTAPAVVVTPSPVIPTDAVTTPPAPVNTPTETPTDVPTETPTDAPTETPTAVPGPAVMPTVVPGQGLLTIYFLDVGEADAALVVCDGQTLLIDCGEYADTTYVRGWLKDKLGLTSLDYVVATHEHGDHIGSIAGLMSTLRVGRIYTPVLQGTDRPFERMKEKADELGVPMVVPARNEEFHVGGAVVTILSEAGRTWDDVNNTSIVLRIDYGQNSFLFTGDAEQEAEQLLLSQGARLQADVLKVGHHGARTSSTQAFLQQVRPGAAVISVMAGNDHGHPHDETLSRLNAVGASIYRTDEHGVIICRCDGQYINWDFEK